MNEPDRAPVIAEPDAAAMEAPVPAPVDPGGAHAKGYSAEAGKDVSVPDTGPIPVAGQAGTILQPEHDGQVQPTGRSQPGGYSPNDRLMGADR